MNATAHPLVEGYLRSLDGAAKVLPRREREELVGEIRSHLDEALTPESSEADIRNVLDSLGTPWDIVAAAGGETRTVRRGAREAFALVLLVTGLPPLIGWVIGLGLLVWSPLWTTRQKWLGALVWPGGLMSLLFTFTLPASSSSVTLCSSSSANPVTTCTTSGGGMNPLWWIVIAVAVAAPMCVAVYLWRAAGRRSAG